MRPDSAPHLYDPSMVPNLLPFSASVTTGAGSTQSAIAAPQGQPGFAAMLGLGMTPVTQDATGTPVAVSVMPRGTAPLLGLTDGSIEAALPDLANIPDPATLDATPIATLPEAPIKVAAPAPSPEGGSVTVVDGPLKTPEPVLETVTVVDGPYKPAPVAEPAPGDLETVTVVDGPYKPAPIAKPVAEPAPDGVGGTVTTVDRPDKSVETAPVGDPVPAPVVAPIVKPANPTPAPEGGSGPIVEPVRKTSVPKTPSVVEDGSVTVVDGPRKDAMLVADTLIAPPETATVAAPVETAPVVTEAAAAPLAPATHDDAPEPQAQPVALAAALATPVPTQTSATPVQPANGTAPVPTAALAAAPARAPEAPPADVAADLPVDDGAFDGLVVDAAPDADPQRTSSEAANDTMNRDGSRQSAPQPAAATPAPTSAGPVPNFDPLAAANAADAARATADSTATEPRARANAIGEDVGLAIVRHADTGSGDVLVIRLDPAELGKIEVRLRMDEARQLSADVTADQPATLELLRRDSDNLTRALNDAGFRADDQSLRFDQRGQSDQQSQQGRRVANHAYLTEDDALASSIPSPVQVRSSGRVDLVA